MRIVQRTLAAAALTMLLITAPAVQLPAQRPIQIAPPIDLQDCESLRRELEELQRELADTNREIQQLQRRINALDARISDFRERLRNPDSNMKWWPGVDVEAINSMLVDRLEAAVLARSRLIKELREYQQRLVELRKLIAELLKLLEKCQPQSRVAPEPQPPQQVGQTPPLKLTPANQRILDLHNRERVAVGAPPLQWDPALAWTATAYAAEMARTGKFGHASREGRGIVRENINQAFHGSSPDQLMANWLNEKRNFVGGTFPNVSRTGNWDDVGHYSQIIWPTTTHVGCGSARGARWDYFVCRYSPGGNKDGQPVGPAPPAN